LRPTLKILEFANDQSVDRARAASLLREQLRRNGLLHARYPTSIIALQAKVEGAVQAKDVADVIGGKLPPSSTLFKVRCVALVDLISVEEVAYDLEPYLLEDGTVASQYREEWVVYRSMKDFQALHKHLKSEVATAESSASTGSRIVGAATAAFSNNAQGRRQRKALIPSLAQASKTGVIAVTKKAIMKKGELLDGYLEYLLSSNHIMNRCMELLLFLGASYPFPHEVKVLQTPKDFIDPLGRLSFIRSVSVALNGSAKEGRRVAKILQADGSQRCIRQVSSFKRAEGY
jgi:hypothetical protein